MTEPDSNPNPKVNPEPSAPPRSDRTWLYVAVAFIAFWGVYLALFGPKMITEEPRIDMTVSHGQADYGWAPLDLDDNPVEFSRFKGKVVFLNVWATWCGPCVREMPSIAALASDRRLKDVAFVCISADESASDVKTFVAGKNWPMTVLRSTRIPPIFRTDGIPATFLIAPDGRIAAAELGSKDWNTPDTVEALELLLAGPAKSSP